MAPNDGEDGLYRALSYAIEKAWAEAEMKDIEAITKAIEGIPDKLLLNKNEKVIIDAHDHPVVEQYGLALNWKAAVWRLERKFPDKWGKRIKIEEANLTSSMEIEFIEPLNIHR